MMDEGLVAKHAVLHGVSLDNCLLLFIDKTLCKFSSCMKSRFSCISVFVLSLEDTEDGAVSTKALFFKMSSRWKHNRHSLLIIWKPSFFSWLDHLQQNAKRVLLVFYSFISWSPAVCSPANRPSDTDTGRVYFVFAVYFDLHIGIFCILEFRLTQCVFCMNFVLNYLRPVFVQCSLCSCAPLHQVSLTHQCLGLRTPGFVKLADDDVFAEGRGASLGGCAYQPNYTWVIDIRDIHFLPHRS